VWSHALSTKSVLQVSLAASVVSLGQYYSVTDTCRFEDNDRLRRVHVRVGVEQNGEDRGRKYSCSDRHTEDWR
jgi:hypothetical protein